MDSMSQDTGTDKRRATRSNVWDHFIKIDDSQGKAQCVYCEALIAFKHGTTAMHTHLSRCKQYPYGNVEKRQKDASGQFVGVGKFDQDASRKDLAAMFIIAELPLKFVENEAFQKFVRGIQPKFLIPSRNTLRQACYDLFLEQRNKLKKYFSDISPRVCLTIDTWSSCQNLSYMCLTAHFVDSEWKLQKRILNFCQIPGHSGEIIGKAVEKCLIGWGIKNIFSITVDNASSNDLGVQYLKKRLIHWNSLLLDGELLHMRCCAHIVSLIVREGLKDDSIVRIRSAVRYLRSSPPRLQRFKKCVELEGIESKSLVCLDVETRWNSTYLMLEAALKFEKAFISLEMEDPKFFGGLSKMRGGTELLTSDDWEYARGILPFLKMFYDMTLKVSDTSYVTSNDLVKDIYGIFMMINNYCENEDKSLREMAKKMLTEFNKYFGNVNNINLSLFIACILDPRHKWKYVDWLINYFYEIGYAEILKEKVRTSLKLLFEQYLTGVCPQSNFRSKGTRSMSVAKSPVVGVDILTDMYLRQNGRQYFEEKSELDKYLKEDSEGFSPNFDILTWWKVNSSRYPILSSIARDILAMPVSTGASESAFSTGSRVLDEFHSSLTPSMVEALKCTQDWLRSTPLSVSIEEDLAELENFESDLSTTTVELNSILISVDD